MFFHKINERSRHRKYDTFEEGCIAIRPYLHTFTPFTRVRSYPQSPDPPFDRLRAGSRLPIFMKGRSCLLFLDPQKFFCGHISSDCTPSRVPPFCHSSPSDPTSFPWRTD